MQKLPADPGSLVISIISVVLLIAGCCCGFPFLSLILSIIGLIMANKSIRLFRNNPELYDAGARGNVNAGRIINIICIVIAGLGTLVYLFYFLIYGAMFSSVFMDAMDEYKNAKDSDTFENYEYDENEWDYEEDNDSISQPSDTLVIDTFEIEEVEEIEAPEN